MARLPRALTLVVLLAAVLTLSLSRAADGDVADTGYWTVTGPIPASDCSIVTPNPPYTNCDNFPAPTGDADIFKNLPWSNADYKACVIDRCNCTAAANTLAPSYQPNGIYCQDGLEWAESGETGCNAMVDCFKKFWQCTTYITWNRYLNLGLDALEASEKVYVNAILEHGESLGESFEETNQYKSCAAIQCEAAMSRKNCGLITCRPNNTQCVDFIQSPPAPMNEVLCSAACQGALLVMALTIVSILLSCTCGCCCPPRVRQLKPLVAEADQLSRSSAIISSSDNDEAEQPLQHHAPRD